LADKRQISSETQALCSLPIIRSKIIQKKTELLDELRVIWSVKKNYHMIKMKEFVLTFLCFGAALSACSAAAPNPTSTPTLAPSSTATPLPNQTPSPTATSTPSETPTQAPTHTQTEVPFAGFHKDFHLYHAWNNADMTYFYFFQANITDTLYAKADDYDLICNPDSLYPYHMQCVADVKVFGEDAMTFTFYTDEGRSHPVFSQVFYTGLVNDIVYHHANDCPDRGKNVHCESEYRLYDGRCYYAHTCYDACGLYYSRDNLPKVWNEFQGYTVPCN
jgi:hypothetical protein